MKTKSKILLAVAATSMIAVACNKTKHLNPSCQTSSSSNTKANVLKVKDPKNKPNGVYQTSGQWAGWCSPSAAVNCKMLKMITVSAFTLLNELDGASGEAVANAMNSEVLISFTESIPADYLDKLKSGRYFIHMNSENETLINYIIGTSNPVNGENMEFSIQVEKGQ